MDSDVGARRGLGWGALWRLVGYMRPYRGLVLVVFISMFASGGLDLVRPLLIREVVDRVIVAGQTEQLPWLIAAIIGVSLIHGGTTFAFTYFRRFLGERIVYDLRNELYGHLHYLDARFFHGARTGELMSRTATDVQAVRHLMGFGLFTLGRTMISFSFVVAAALTLSPHLTAIVLLAGPGLYLTVRSFRQQIKPAFRRIHEQNANLSAVLQENVTGVRVVRSFGQEEQEERKFDRENWESLERHLAAARIRARHAPMMDFWGFVSRALLLLAGGWFVMEGRVTIGTFVALDGYLARLMQPIREFHHLIDLLGEGLSSGERIFELLDTKPGLVDPAPEGKGTGHAAGRGAARVRVNRPDGYAERMEGVATGSGEALWEPGGASVEFQGVWLSYIPGRWVLEDVNLAVRPGEIVAIVGETGAGKSSLVQLINRTYDPDRGRVLLNGRDLREYPLQQLRRHVAIVRQESFLFSASVRENIGYGRPEAGDEEIEEAARIAQAHEFIVRLPQGYDTVVGERGAGLSGGQRQRIAIARALMMRPAVLILDDATSAVDMETEFQIWQGLSRVFAGRTVFIVAQRLTTLQRVDRIVVLERGRVVEVGSHRELMERNGVYARMFRMQAEEVEDPALAALSRQVTAGFPNRVAPKSPNWSGPGFPHPERGRADGAH